MKTIKLLKISGKRKHKMYKIDGKLYRVIGNKAARGKKLFRGPNQRVEDMISSWVLFKGELLVLEDLL